MLYLYHHTGNQFCCHWWHRMLLLLQYVVPPVKIKLASWQLGFSVTARRPLYSHSLTPLCFCHHFSAQLISAQLISSQLILRHFIVSLLSSPFSPLFFPLLLSRVSLPHIALSTSQLHPSISLHLSTSTPTAILSSTKSMARQEASQISGSLGSHASSSCCQPVGIQHPVAKDNHVDARASRDHDTGP